MIVTDEPFGTQDLGFGQKPVSYFWKQFCPFTYYLFKNITQLVLMRKDSVSEYHYV